MKNRTIKPYNQAGLKFLKFDDNNHSSNDKYIVECTYCHNVFSIWATSYYQNKNTCTCLKPNIKLYKLYYNIKTRCYNEKSSSADNYIQRGITMCQEWYDDYWAFQNWALNHGYKDGLTIDRINNNGNYSPDNCRWTDVYEQANNKRNNIMLVVNHCKTSLKHFCNLYSLNYKTVTDYFYSHNRDMNILIKYLKNKIKDIIILPFNYEEDYCRPLLSNVNAG